MFWIGTCYLYVDSMILIGLREVASFENVNIFLESPPMVSPGPQSESIA